MPPLATTRTIECWLSRADAQKLSRGGFRWHVARQFYSRDGSPTSTLLRSLPVAPRNRVSWETTYALNWTLHNGAEEPIDINDVEVNGQWQRCELGEAYELDQSGFWTPAQGSDKDHMTISINRYRPDDGHGVHVVIGQRSASKGEWEPMYADTVELGANMKAWYRPSEQVEWWFESGPSGGPPLTASTSRGVSTTKESINMAEPDDVGYCSTTYDFGKGEWRTSLRLPPSSLKHDDDLSNSDKSATMGALALRSR